MASISLASSRPAAKVASVQSSFLGSPAQVVAAKHAKGLPAMPSRAKFSTKSGNSCTVAMFNCDCDFHRQQRSSVRGSGMRPFQPSALPTETMTTTLAPAAATEEIEEWKEEMFKNNREWADSLTAKDPDYFKNLAKGQSPEILWIGCADSRMPANSLLGKKPGEVFVHRNIANVVVHTDINALSVMEYSIMVLKVKHVIVCGHYNCGGVLAASQKNPVGLVDNWLRNIREVRNKHIGYLESLPEAERFDKLVELNVLEQVKNVASTSIVQQAWARGQELTVHGFVYDLRNGLVKEVGVEVSGPEDLPQPYRLTLPPPVVPDTAPKAAPPAAAPAPIPVAAAAATSAPAGFKNPLLQILAWFLSPFVALVLAFAKFFGKVASDVESKIA